MNNSSDPRDPATRLMAETFHDEWSTGPAAAMAQRAAAHARARRRTRRVLAAGSAVALVALAAYAGFSRRTLLVSPTVMPSSSLAINVAVKKTPAYEIISDAELETIMRDRAVLVLPQADGAKKIVVLER